MPCILLPRLLQTIIIVFCFIYSVLKQLDNLVEPCRQCDVIRYVFSQTNSAQDWEQFVAISICVVIVAVGGILRLKSFSFFCCSFCLEVVSTAQVRYPMRHETACTRGFLPYLLALLGKALRLIVLFVFRAFLGGSAHCQKSRACV